MSYIQGPAILKIGGNAFYFKDGIKEEITRSVDAAKDDIWGTVQQHVTGTVIKLTGTPTPMRRNMSTLFPYAKSDLGASIFSPTVAIYTKAGKSYTYGRGALTKSPTLNLSAAGDIFKDGIEVTCIAKLDEAVTTSGHWRVIATTSFPTQDFDETKIKRYRYTAAWGSSPFDAMTAQEGFEFSVAYKFDEIPDANIGRVADIALSDLEVQCKFTPSNLTEANLATLLAIDGAGALAPGDILGSALTDLVITGGAAADGVTVTMRDAQAANAEHMFATGKLRFGQVGFFSKMTFSSGTPASLFTFTEL